MRGVTELISKNIIQPVYDKCPFKKKAHSYKLQPLAYTAVTMLAEREKFIDFDEQGNPMREYSRSLRSCLVPQKDNKLENEAESSHGRNYNSNSRTTSSSKSGNSKPIMAHVVYNLNDVFLQLKREWFTEMKHVNILYLGRWESTTEKHIELEEPKDLEGLANLKYGIGSLHNLTHLDLLECYLLSGMPKGLRELRNLVVLKGFEVQDSAEKSHSCTLEDLLAMKKLRKLSIHTEIEVFPRCSDLDVLAKFKQLRILTIEWGGNLFRNNPDSYKTWYAGNHKNNDSYFYPEKEEGNFAIWVNSEFEKVPTPWNNVKTLHLKYLTEMEMDWTEFRELFPEVEYLEKVKCPKPTMFPCNTHGDYILML
ncbi:hypothetical protein P3S67_022065 [Capsicum chacoense]